jgi:ParB family chromosome partitioning protein
VSKQRRLGKGIDALLQGRDLGSIEGGELNSVVTVPIDRIQANPDQPRKTFTPESLEELARSIEERGIIQPILAEEQEDGSYTIIAGERRFRAATMAGLTVVPVLPGVFSEDEKLEIALIENIQRQNLTPIEEARAYRELMERSSLSQEELAHRLGKSRPAVANSLRLLKLPEETQELVNTGTLSAGHARTLLGITDTTLISDAVRIVLDEGLSVRALEQLVAFINQGRSPDEAHRRMSGPVPDVTEDGDEGSSARVEAGDDEIPPVGGRSGTDPRHQDASKPGAPRKSVEMEQIQQQLMERLGTRVLLTGTNDRGKIEITYLSMEDLDRLIELLLPGAASNG